MMKKIFGKHKKEIFLATAAVIVLALPVFFLTNRLAFSDSNVCWNWGPDQASTFPKDKLIQSFSPEKDGLRSITVKPLLENDIFDTAQAKFVINDSDQNILFSKEIRHIWMENGKMLEVLVPAEKFHKGETYSLEITPLIEKTPGHILGFWIINGGCYSGKLEVDGKKVGKADLAVIFGYSQNSLADNWKAIFERMGQFKPLWLKDGLAFPVLFLLFISGTLLLLILLARKIGNDD